MQIQHVLVLLVVLFVLGGLLFTACKSTQKATRPGSKPVSHVVHPEWSRDAVIYEVNIRQYTPEGTFKAFEEHLPRLKALGVDLLWFMPINPIGEKNRKGSLGSYYSVRDYTGVNPEFGTLADFKHLVNKAHEMGMHVIIDWVANHTAWDNAWVKEHPDWYVKDENGDLKSPFDWTDVVKLDYNVQEMRQAMIGAMQYWLSEADIDGYRCDVAAEVPLDFWNELRPELDKIKPVFMLAEAEVPAQHEYAFDMSYAWELHHLMNSIAKKEKNANDLQTYFLKNDTLFSPDAYRMSFITNHDENSWNGTEYERMGDAVHTFAMLTFTLPGMPLIYSGQEAAFDRRLLFFEKDSIDWGPYPRKDFYKKLIELRKDNPALWSGLAGGEIERIKTVHPKRIFAFRREKGDNEVVVITNLGDSTINVPLKNILGKKDWKDLETGSEWVEGGSIDLLMHPWEYRVLFRYKD